MPRVTPWISIVTCVCFITVTSCAKTVRIPRSSYVEAEIVNGETYRLETVEDEVYVTNHLFLADSTFAIRSLRDGRNWIYIHPPIEVAIKDVRSLETGGMSGKQKADVVLASVLVVGLVTLAAVFIAYHYFSPWSEK